MSMWVAGATVLGTVGAGYLASEGNKDAAKKSAQGSQAAIDQSNYQFETIRNDTAPYRAIGNQALNALGSIYGYQPANSFYGSSPIGPNATPYQAPQVNTTNVPGGSLNIGGTLAASGKYGGIGKLLDPVGSLFGNKHGDEKRNLKAFTSENQIYDVGNGMLSLQDGTQFKKSQLQDVAGAWYGANYAPDGNQEQWQQTYSGLITPPQPQGQQPGQAAQGQAPTNALTSPDYSNFFKSPDYTFRRDEGTKGIERTAAARGGAFSGNALKALNEFNSNLAGSEFGNYFNRQAALAGIGQTATAQTNQAGLYTSNMVGNAVQNQGDARASGVVGSANAWGNALSGVAQGAGYYFGNRAPANADPSGIGYFKPTVRRV